MDNLDDDQEFNSEEVSKIAKAAMEMVCKADKDVPYQKDKVNTWCQNIVDSCIKELNKLNKPFKYAVTCIIMQDNGTGLQTAATAYWDHKNDGIISVQLANEGLFSSIITIFAMAI